MRVCHCPRDPYIVLSYFMVVEVVEEEEVYSSISPSTSPPSELHHIPQLPSTYTTPLELSSWLLYSFRFFFLNTSNIAA